MGFLMLLGLVAAGQPGLDPCQQARAHYEALSLTEADEVARAGLAADPRRPLACLEVRALALIGLGREEEARGVLTELFTRAPDYEISDLSLSPAVRERIAAIQASVRPLTSRVLARWIGNETLRVDIELTGGLRNAAKIRYEVTEPVVLQGEVDLVGRAATATLAVASEVEMQRLRLGGEVLTQSGQRVHAMNHDVLLPERPLALEPVVVERQGGPPWWIWAIVGTVVVGAAASIAVVSQPDVPDGEGLGRLGVDP